MNALPSTTLRLRLFLGFGAVLLLMAVLTVVGISQVNSIDEIGRAHV